MSAVPTSASPEISVLVFVFNHEKFLEKALASVEMQVLDTDFEIVIHDDASTDTSEQICRRFAATSKHKVKIIRQAQNKISRRISFWPEIIAQCEGALLCFFDGDDFWTSPLKLQNQWLAMRVRPDVDLCFHRVTQVDHLTEEPMGLLGDFGDEPKLIPASAVIAGDGGFIPTPAIMLRRTILTQLPEWFFRPPPVEDYFLQVFSALRGGVLYLPMQAAAYRSGDPHSWSQRMAANPVKRMDFERNYLEFLCILSESLPVDLRPFLEQLIMRHYLQLINGAMVSGNYADIWRASAYFNEYKNKFI